MNLKTTSEQSKYIKITAHDGDKVIGRVFLYIIKNDLHEQPYGFLEDAFVDEEHRKQGIGSELIKKAIEQAQSLGCYKLVGNSRLEKENVHSFYERLGFKKHGHEFRLDLK